MWEYQCSCCDFNANGFATFFEAQEDWETHMLYDHEPMYAGKSRTSKIYLSSIVFVANKLEEKMYEGVDIDGYLADLREADKILNTILNEVK